MTKGVSGIIRLKDEASSTLKSIRSENTKLRDDTKSTFQELKKTFGQSWKAKLDSSDTMQKLRQIKANTSGLKEGIKAKINLSDNATKQISSIKNKLSILGKTIVSPFVNLKDATTTKIKQLRKDVFSLNGLKARITAHFKDESSGGIEKAKNSALSLAKIGKIVIALTIAGTGAKVLENVLSSGMQLEQQQVSIKHFIGATDKSLNEKQIDTAATEFTNALRENANATPFETGEVIQAGSRAIAITQGNRDDAMGLVQLAEDMAAASGGTKNVSDAMEALADAKLGEMERLKEFGFKVSADDFEQKGFSGVSKDLQDFYGGAASKLASTGSGLLSTITGKLKSGISDFGLKVVEKLKPVFTDVISFIDKAMPYIDKFGTAFGETIGQGIQTASQMIPKLVAGFQTIKPFLDQIVSSITAMMPSIMAFAGTVGSAVSGIAAVAMPVIAQIVEAIAQVLPVLEPIFSTIVTAVGNIVETVLPPLGDAFSFIADVICAIAPPIQTAVETIATIITDSISGIVGVITGGLDLFRAIWDGDWQGIVDSFGSIFSGIAEICKAPVNAVIGIINSAITAINGISVDIPDWVPVVGGDHWGLDIPQIPMLAKGGIVDKPTQAIVGEAGKEAVMPLENNTGWIGKLAGNISGMLNTGITSTNGNGLSTFMRYLNDGLNQIQMAFKYQSMPLAYAGNNASIGKENKDKQTIVHMENTIYVDKDVDIDEVGEEIVKKIKKAVENS